MDSRVHIVGARHIITFALSPAYHQSQILSRRLQRHFQRHGARFIFCQKNALSLCVSEHRGVCFVINRANQSITALIMARLTVPTWASHDKCAASTWGIRPNIPPTGHRRSLPFIFPALVCCSSPTPPMIKSETGARVNKAARLESNPPSKQTHAREVHACRAWCVCCCRWDKTPAEIFVFLSPFAAAEKINILKVVQRTGIYTFQTTWILNFYVNLQRSIASQIWINLINLNKLITSIELKLHQFIKFELNLD